MSKKVLIFIFIIILFLVLLFTFLSKEINFMPTVSKKVEEQLYINSIDNNDIHRVIKLNLNNYSEEILLERDVIDYPTSIYDVEKDNLYFTSELDDGTRQLHSKNINSNKIKVLTKDLNYIDFLQLNEKKKLIYMRALIKSDDRNFHIVIYDIETGSTDILNEKEYDESVVSFDYSPSLNKILVVTKSIKEEFKSISNANDNNVSPKPPIYKIFTYSELGKLEKEELRINSFIKSASISSNGEKILLNFKDKLEETSKIGFYSKNEKKIELLLEDRDELLNIREPIFNSSESGFYFIGDDKEDNSKIYFFNFEDKNIKDIWSNKNQKPINIYQRE